MEMPGPAPFQAMKLLILTQKVDRNDPVLGFFHRWLEEFAKHCERVTVIALSVGEHSLPENVRVHSLGKEHGVSRFAYALNFYRYIWRERQNYDAVFVHMNQEYLLLGGMLWKILGKKIALWRNHPLGSPLTSLAVFLSDAVFATSKYSYVGRFEKTKLMPVGIDTDRFRPLPSAVKKDRSILMLGRISPIKKVDEFVEALSLLRKQNVSFSADIIGDAALRDKVYYTQVAQKISKEGLSDTVLLKPGVKNEETPEIYNAYTVFINLTPTGSFDKTILEAMACGTLAVSTNKILQDAVPPLFVAKEGSVSDETEHLKEILALSQKEKERYGTQLRDYVIARHSLTHLVSTLVPLLKCI
jgi:glycosyltransferase involved in cell wall biosynthesis